MSINEVLPMQGIMILNAMKIRMNMKLPDSIRKKSEHANSPKSAIVMPKPLVYRHPMIMSISEYSPFIKT
jgi:hypothetical protein